MNFRELVQSWSSYSDGALDWRVPTLSDALEVTLELSRLGRAVVLASCTCAWSAQIVAPRFGAKRDISAIQLTTTEVDTLPTPA
jgi:hypothetical protein